MNQALLTILDIIKQSEGLSEEEKNIISDLIKKVDNELIITTFKLDRTEKVKRITSILLEETIDELEKKREDVVVANEALKTSLEELKATQAQLIHSEKMASLGELTAGIAHEIQNPLNFVNNFSEVSKELLEELKNERIMEPRDRDEDLQEELIEDIIQNLAKIHHHGQRASSIVKGMLEHSRSGNLEKELTDINKLADEYLRLSYHGLRAKDNSFNADFKLELDPAIPEIKVIGQDIGRVVLNLINNAFYAVINKYKEGAANYQPEVILKTKKNRDTVEIIVQDNGGGIPENVLHKIFQPFFTTKPTGQGTGLGLSLSYDIITKGHGGNLNVDTKEGLGTVFTVQLPIE